MKIWNFQISNPEERKDEEEKDTKGSHKIKSKHGKHQGFIFFNFNVFFGCLIRIYFLWIYKLRFIYLSFIYLNIYDYE